MVTPRLTMDYFHGREGLRAPCVVVDCKGDIIMRRDQATLELLPSAHCTLCGQEFTFGTELRGMELEQQLRGV